MKYNMLKTAVQHIPQVRCNPQIRCNLQNSPTNFIKSNLRKTLEIDKKLLAMDLLDVVDKTQHIRLVNGVPEDVKEKVADIKTPFLIGVGGGTASGKSTVCKKIMKQLGQADMDHTQRQVVAISQDSFYRDLTPAEKVKAQKGLFNFDHPDAFNEQLMYETLQSILKGIKVEIPTYDYRTNSLDFENKLTIYPADVVLFEGILVFYFPKIRDLFHMKLFVDTDSDTRLARRVPRDINERGRDLDAVLTQYMTFVKPAFEEFCSPTKKFADVIIPRGADNTVAIDLIVQHIRDFLNNRSHHGSTTNISLYMETSGSGDAGGKAPNLLTVQFTNTTSTNSSSASTTNKINTNICTRPH